MNESIRDRIVVASMQAVEYGADGFHHGITANESATKKMGVPLKEENKTLMANYVLKFLEGLFCKKKIDLIKLVDQWLISVKKKADPML